MQKRIEQLREFLRPFTRDGIILAYSGGTDSAFLLAVLQQLHTENRFPFSAMMLYSPFQKTKETSAAQEFAKSLEAPLQCLSYDPFKIREICENSPERCYFCKQHFFSLIQSSGKQQGLRWIMDGTNADDLQEYRPGQKALREAGVRSPLAELGFSKKEIRQCSRVLGLRTADLPAAPCLATRFPYGTHLTPQKLQLAAECEKILESVLPEQCIFRVRLLPKKTLIEVEKSHLSQLQNRAAEILQKLNSLGCPAPEIDPEGYRSGKFDPGK